MKRRGQLAPVAAPLGAALLVVLTAAVAAAQHPSITLMDTEGNTIDPIAGTNDTVPFSTEQTCGLCHDYDTITKGYHFQMGWNTISDDYGVAAGRPWSLSDGFLGRWYPYAYRQLARKHNTSPDQIDMTVYDFVGSSSPGPGQPPCGACHPGGGGLERDRDGNRYDEYLAAHPELAGQPDGDYYHSKWDRSGVVEADCLICHLEGYDFEKRVGQLRRGNYRWAVVAGSRLGLVRGSVARSDTPSVVYERRLFNEDGTITLKMSWPPPDDNCMYCHGSSDVRKRGFTWNDVFNPDIHNEQGISCAACHRAGLDHQIAKGSEPEFTVAPEYDDTVKGCADCHGVGAFGAPLPEHRTIRPSHIERIACESCHTPYLNRAAVRGLDTTTGDILFYVEPPSAKAAGDLGEWQPDYERRPDGLIHPLNPVLAIWWGNRDADGLIYPLFLRTEAAAWERYSDQVTDDNGDGRPEVNRPEEIEAGLRAFAATLAGNERFQQVHPVLIKGGRVHELDSDDRLTATPLAGTPLEGADQVDFSITHNTAAPGMALGSGGCDDCHSGNAHFFKGARVVDLSGPGGAPVTQPNGRFFGCSPISFFINSFHQRIITPYAGPLIMIVIFLIVLHYHSYGPKRITFDPYSDEVHRFSLLERTIHLFRLLAFIFLAVTGLIMAFNRHLWQDLLFGSPARLVDVHIWSGIVFIITTVGGALLWFHDAMFSSYDVTWVRRIGGYLGYRGEVPSGRFNAGQKMFYWYSVILGGIMSVTGVMLIFKRDIGLPTVCVTSTVHNLSGFFLIAGVVAHAYLGTVANPGTWHVLVDGSVSRTWARHHHPNWYRDLLASGRLEPEEGEVPPPEDEGEGDDGGKGGGAAGPDRGG